MPDDQHARRAHAVRSILNAVPDDMDRVETAAALLDLDVTPAEIEAAA